MVENLQWFVIRVTYSREIKLKKYLDTKEIRCFLPMHYVQTDKNGQKQRVLVPIVHNLVFVFSDRPTIQQIKQELESKIPIRYMMDKGTNAPIVIDQATMQHFITMCETMDEGLIYMTKISSKLKMGERVRITEGIFAGVEGRVVRIKKNKRVMVLIDGLMAVATTYIDSSLLRVIENTENHQISLSN